MLSKGDKVQVLDDDFEGIVLKADGNQVTIETTDGFEMTYFVNEVVKVNDSSDLNKRIGSFSRNEINRIKEADNHPKNPQVTKVKGEIPPPEYDLHIEKLIKNHHRLDQADILSIQTDNARFHVEHALRNRIPKIVLIHGVGEGVLKQELEYMLKRYDNLTFRDADFRKYGVGATEVVFKQNIR